MKKILSLLLTALVGLSLWSCQEEDPPFIYVEQESILAESEPYKATIVVKSNVDWTVSSGAAWCSVFGEKGSYRGSFELVLDRNATIDDRTTNVTLTGGGQTKVISVTQTSSGYGFSLPLSEYSTDNKAQSVRIAYVLSRQGATVEAFSNSDWAKPGAVKDGFAEVSIEENKTGKIREAEISLVARGGSGDPVTVVASILQSDSEDILDVLVDEIALGSEGETRRIPVQSNSELGVVSSESWCVAAADGDFIVISADANTTGKAREAYISLSLKDGNDNARTKLIKVTQAASDITLELLVSKVSLSRTGNVVKIPYTSDAQLTLESGADWCTAVLDGTFIAVSGEENTTGAERTAYLKVTAVKAGKEISRVVMVTQGVEDIVLDVADESLLINAAGDARNIPYTSDCPVTVKASESWIKAEVSEDGIAVSADANNTGAERAGFLTITAKGKGKTLSKTVKVLQAKAEVILELPVTEAFLNRLGEELALPFASNVDVEAASGADWCMVTVREKFIAITATENTTGESRETFVTISTVGGNGTEISRSIHVIQGTTDILLEIAAEQVTLNRLGSAVSIPVITDAAQVIVKASDSWCSAEMTDDVLSVSAQENATGKERKTFVTLVAKLAGKEVTKVLNVTQSTEDLVLDIPCSELTINAAGDGRVIPCTSEGEISAEASEDWISVKVSGKKVTVSALKNDTGANREGFLTVTAQAMGKTVVKTVKVLQARGEVVLELPVKEVALNRLGEEKSLPFESNVDVKAFSAADWCKATIKDSFITFTANENTTGESRETFVTITTVSGNGTEISRSIHVTQGTTDILFEVATEQITLNRLGNAINIPVVTDAAQVSVKANDNWCIAEMVDDVLTVSALKNATGKERKTFVTLVARLAGKEVTKVLNVTQSTEDLVLDISYSEISLNAAGEGRSIPCSSEGEISVEASEDWINAKVSDNTITVSAQSNPTGADREGILTVTAKGMGKTVVKTIRILQSRFEILLDVPAAETLLNLEGDEVKIPYSSNVSVVASASASWCHVDSDNSFIILSAERNGTGNDRSCMVTVTTDSNMGKELTHVIKVVQTTTEVLLYVFEKEITFVPAGGSMKIPFISAYPVKFKATEDWIQLETTSDSLVTISAGKNESGMTREGYVMLTTISDIGKEATEAVKVTQDAYEVKFEFVHPEMELEYYATNTTATLLASGDWEITNLANKPAWISINPTSGTGGATFEIKVGTNKFMAKRSFAFAFRNTTHDKFASLTVTQAGDPTGIKDLGYLGRGYDASGEYAVDSYVRHNVLDQDSLVLYDHVADIISVNATKEETFTGSTRSEYESSYSVSAGVSGSYKGFTASIESHFSQSSLESSEHSFGTWRHMTQKKKLTLFQNEGAVELVDALSNDFRRDIGYGGQTANRLTPDLLVQKYGTHVVTGYAVGGVLEYSMSADATSTEQSTNWGVAVKGGFESAAFGVSASVSYDQFNSVKNSSASFESNLSCRGGQSQYSSMTAMGSQSMYNEWLTSLESPSEWVMVNYESPMIPIYEFIDDVNYRDQVEDYLKLYLKGLTIEQHSTHKDLTLTVVSASTNMSDAGDDCEFYWKMFVKNDNQPWYYSQGINGDDWGVENISVKEDGTEKAIGKSGTLCMSPLKNHTVKIEFKDVYEEDSTNKDKFLDKLFNVTWDGSRWSCNGVYANDDGTFKLELSYDSNNNEKLWILCKLEWEK